MEPGDISAGVQRRRRHGDDWWLDSCVSHGCGLTGFLCK